MCVYICKYICNSCIVVWEKKKKSGIAPVADCESVASEGSI